MKKILFVCTGNSCRSVMAEGLFRKHLGSKAKEYSGISAGISALDGYSASPETIRAMKEEGVDVSDHQSQRLTPDLIQSSSKIIVMERMHRDWVLSQAPEAKAKVFLLTDFVSKDMKLRTPDIDIPDPIRMSESFYKNVLHVIRNGVVNLVKTL